MQKATAPSPMTTNISPVRVHSTAVRRSPFAVATALWSPTVDDYANPKLRSQLSAPLSRCGKRAPFLSRDRAAIGFPPLSEGVTIDLVLVGLTVESSLPNS